MSPRGSLKQSLRWINVEVSARVGGSLLLQIELLRIPLIWLSARPEASSAEFRYIRALLPTRPKP